MPAPVKIAGVDKKALIKVQIVSGIFLVINCNDNIVVIILVLEAGKSILNDYIFPTLEVVSVKEVIVVDMWIVSEAVSVLVPD